MSLGFLVVTTIINFVLCSFFELENQVKIDNYYQNMLSIYVC